MLSGILGGLAERLSGVEVKQLLGLEFGRSALTGVGLILREGLVALQKKTHKSFIFFYSGVLFLNLYYMYLS